MRGHRAVDEIEHRNLIAAIRAVLSDTPPHPAATSSDAPVDGDIRFL